MRRIPRSLLTVEAVLRLVAVLMAALIVVRVLFAGADGLRTIILVVSSTGAIFAVGYMITIGRALVADAAARADPDSPLPAVLAQRTPAPLLALLALVILVVHAGITGYVGVWTILVAVLLAAVAALLSSNLRLVALIGGTAVAFAIATVFVENAFDGSAEARALAVSVAGVVLPVLVSDKLSSVVKLPPLTATHNVILAVLTLTLGFLGWTREDWLPGVANGCYTLPTSTGITMLRATSDGSRCYGLLDTHDAGVFASPAFGKDPVTVKLQQAIFKNNRPLKDGDLTVVWMGALSCDPLPGDRTRCADGRDYPSERDQLRALLFAQTHLRDVHVVIADATQDVRHADDIAKMIIERRAALGSRLVVIGGGDSRDTTQRAINRLLDAGIPFIAPNLLADLGAPGRPFVDRPGYLQLAPSNLDYAKDTVARLRQRFPEGFRLDAYAQPNPTDLYTTSLVNDLLAAVKQPPGATARHVASLDAVTCDAGTVLFFADRWTRFAEFVQRIKDVCGHERPRMVIADGSVGRFMANYELRAVSNADWPVDYYVGGPGCSDLSPAMYTTLTEQMYRSRDALGLHPGEVFACADRAAGARDRQLIGACTLDAAVKLQSQPCRPNDLGNFLIPAWDAVLLADALLPAKPVPLTELRLAPTTLSTGARAEVSQGRLRRPTVPVLLWHVDPLNDPSRIWERPSDDLRLDTDPTGPVVVGNGR
ncbi:hypothetical protein [Actinoplanes sp. DH11]|uniref:hypothetical protein n=1 Tax=Actinoplanes sp. DH11 TaxID=2857011 RepID=UPI001E44C1FC|nr:hypothetical protein [Actinoplanes sp. DH11]